MKALAALALALAMTAATAPAAPAAATLPHPAHVVVVVEENHTLMQVVGSGHAPYLTAVARAGALFTNAHGETHPSLPNYLALFAGITNDNKDGCPATGISTSAPNLGSELLKAGLTFEAYSEALPSAGWRGCSAGTYARKHAPWVAFSNVPQRLHHPLDDLRSFDHLATVTFIVPDVDDDMHDGTVADGDEWAKKHLAPLVRWADAHDTLVIVTWDEGLDNTNSIPTFFAGPMVRQGTYPEFVDHYRLLRTIEEMYGLPPSGRAAAVAPIVNCWR
jgi:phosphatidylinositol-3-phosphatase